MSQHDKKCRIEIIFIFFRKACLNKKTRKKSGGPAGKKLLLLAKDRFDEMVLLAGVRFYLLLSVPFYILDWSVGL